MNKFLNLEKRTALIVKHRSEKNRKKADRLKAILLSDAGWSNRQISEALLLDQETISRHISEYRIFDKLSNNSGGLKDKFEINNIDLTELIKHLEGKIYQTTDAIIEYIRETYEISYTRSGLTNWLHNQGFSYKKPDVIPAKANKESQDEFRIEYQEIKNSLGENDVILFGDGVHPSMNTKITSGWIKRGINKPMPTTGSRTRINLFGTIDLVTMDIITDDYKTIDSESICDFLKQIKSKYNEKEHIHLFLDQGPYNKSKETLKEAKELGITIHLLPTYSPNLNPIERLWKVANKYVRNNVYFKTAKDFKQKILEFYDKTWHDIKSKMRCRINDNFQHLNFDTLK